MAILKDSGTRREFSTGAVSDICEGKGRCDLMPLHQVIGLIETSETIYDAPIAGVLEDINCFMDSGRNWFLYKAMAEFVVFELNMDIYQVVLEVAKHFEDGAIKYGVDNWKKGIPTHCHLDSALRHYFKFKYYQARWSEAWPGVPFCDNLDSMDEPHHRAFLWRLLCLIWTKENLPEMDDIHYTESIYRDETNVPDLLKKAFNYDSKEPIATVISTDISEERTIVKADLNDLGKDFVAKIIDAANSIDLPEDTEYDICEECMIHYDEDDEESEKNVFIIEEDGTYN